MLNSKEYKWRDIDKNGNFHELKLIFKKESWIDYSCYGYIDNEEIFIEKSIAKQEETTLHDVKEINIKKHPFDLTIDDIIDSMFGSDMKVKINKEFRKRFNKK